jgi:hypothetical protein
MTLPSSLRHVVQAENGSTTPRPMGAFVHREASRAGEASPSARQARAARPRGQAPRRPRALLDPLAELAEGRAGEAWASARLRIGSSPVEDPFSWRQTRSVSGGSSRAELGLLRVVRLAQSLREAQREQAQSRRKRIAAPPSDRGRGGQRLAGSGAPRRRRLKAFTRPRGGAIWREGGAAAAAAGESVRKPGRLAPRRAARGRSAGDRSRPAPAPGTVLAEHARQRAKSPASARGSGEPGARGPPAPWPAARRRRSSARARGRKRRSVSLRIAPAAAASAQPRRGSPGHVRPPRPAPPPPPRARSTWHQPAEFGDLVVPFDQVETGPSSEWPARRAPRPSQTAWSWLSIRARPWPAGTPEARWRAPPG